MAPGGPAGRNVAPPVFRVEVFGGCPPIASLGDRVDDAHAGLSEDGDPVVLTPGGRHGRKACMAERKGIGGISLGGILVIIGIVVAIFWSLLLGLIIALIGLIAFGGFARGKWY